MFGPEMVTVMLLLGIIVDDDDDGNEEIIEPATSLLLWIRLVPDTNVDAPGVACPKIIADENIGK